MNSNKKYLIELCKSRLSLYIDLDGYVSSNDIKISNLLDIALNEICLTLQKIFTWNDCNEIINYSAILIKGAIAYFLGGQALKEKGTEHIYENNENNGIKVKMSNISELLQKQYEIEFADYQKKLDEIKPKQYTVDKTDFTQWKDYMHQQVISSSPQIIPYLPNSTGGIYIP